MSSKKSQQQIACNNSSDKDYNFHEPQSNENTKEKFRYDDEIYLVYQTMVRLLQEDDPPEELYMLSNSPELRRGEVDPDGEEELIERTMMEMEEEYYYHDNDFCLYEHFGIPSDLPEDEQDAMLEAAMGSS